MITLGINTGHDSGAALLSNGKIVAAINEERLSRIKMHHGFPFLSINEVLDIAGKALSEVDVIAIEGKSIMPQEEIGYDEKTGDWKKKWLGNFDLHRFMLGSKTGLSFARMVLSFGVRRQQEKIRRYFSKKGFKGKFEFIDHHYCHAASAYFTQAKDSGIAITLDASGEGFCSRIYKCRNNSMELVNSIFCYHSPAYYYAYITQLLGFKPMRHEGKITGLAAFGKAEKTSAILSRYIYFNPPTLSFVNNGGYHFVAMKRLKNDLKSFSKEDIAAGIQDHTEKITAEYVKHILRKFGDNGSTSIFLAGGLFANVKVNQRILELKEVKDIYVFPNMGDGGLGLGATLSAFFSKSPSSEKQVMSNVYFGKNYSDLDIENALINQKVNYRKSNHISFDIAKAVFDGKVVARFDGAMEYGPRALGNRSILYSAKDKSVNTWLNQRLNRTEFMPFAPVVRNEDFKEYFKINDKNILPFKFMTVTCDVTDHCKQVAPAVTHIDGTARPQIIFREDNPNYYDILTEYKKMSGCGVLVNTSFNMHEEPIINTPEEAITTYKLGGLDVLAIGNYMVEKN